MQLYSLTLICALALPLVACGDPSSPDGDGAAEIGVVAEIEEMAEVTIDDELGTEVRVSVDMAHMGGPDVETLEIVSASLNLDLEHYADIELTVPADVPQFEGLAEGTDFELTLHGSIPDNHDDWGLCADPQAEEADGQRLSLNLELRVTPGANSGEDEFVFESQAVVIHCTHTG